ncbi:MAG: InlB B-repeat-containing protein [Clostridia bacterium]|nr:InlB B-repeat-containing protein [Clostridia bacterium]
MFIKIISAILSAIMLLFNFTPAQIPENKFDVSVEESAYADLQELNKSVEEANTLISVMTGYFEAETWAELSALLAEAEAYSETTSAENQPEIDALASDISAKTAELYNLPANTEELRNAVALAESYNKYSYTPASWSAVETALMNAYNVPDDATVTLQPTINGYTADITEALNNLSAGANYTLLETIYLSYEALAEKKYLYTPESWANLQAVVDDIDWTLDASGDNQYYIDSYTIRLTNAINKLEFVTYDITFHHNDGSDDLIISVRYGEETAEYIPANPVRNGYNFAGWYSDKDLTTEHVFTTMKGDIDVYAKWEKKPETAQLVVSVLGGYGYIRANGAEEVYMGSTHTKSYELNTLCTIRTKASGSNQFLFWYDSRNRVISTDPTYTLAITNDISITAQYANTIDNHYRVVFVDRNNVILSTAYVKHGSSATAPNMRNKYYSGYVFDSWDQDFSSVTSHMIIRGNYVLKQEEYKVEAVGGIIENASADNMYQYDTKITIAPEKLTDANGNKFTGWSDDGGKTIISTEENYSFYVCRDVTITAVYAENITAQPTVTLYSKVVNNYRVTFTVERNLPEGYTFIESGILFTKNEAIVESGHFTVEHALDNEEIKQGRTVSHEQDGQYSVVLVASNTKTYYAKGYVIYLDQMGEIQIAYTDVLSETVG